MCVVKPEIQEIVIFLGRGQPGVVVFIVGIEVQRVTDAPVSALMNRFWRGQTLF